MKSALLLLFISVISGNHLPPRFNQVKSSSSKSKAIPLKSLDNQGYLIDVSIGTPPQKIELLLSTGNSSLSWIVAADCYNCRVAFNSYNPDISSTYRSKGMHTTLNNGYSSFGAYLSTDIFTIENSLTSVPYFWLAEDNYNYQGQVYDGVLGLGLDNDKYMSLIESLFSKGLIDSPIFSIYLSDNDEADSRLILGSPNLEPYIGKNSLNTLNIINILPNLEGWTATLDYVCYENVEYCYEANSIAAFDIGSPYIYLPSESFADIFDYFAYYYGCERTSDIIQCTEKNIQNYPNLTFKFGSQSLTIPNTAYLRYEKKTKTFVLLMMQNTYGDSRWILGIPFLKEFVSVFTQGIGTQSTIGFAKIGINSQSSSTKSSNFWNDWSLYFYIGIGVAGGLITVILLIVLYRCKKRRQAKRNQENSEKLIYNIIEPPKPEPKPKKSISKSKPTPPPPQPPKVNIENPPATNHSNLSDSESGIYPDLQPVPILRHNFQENAEIGAYPSLPPVKEVEY